MKKIFSLSSLTILLFFACTGCHKEAISGEKAAILFADELVSHDRSKTFEKNFIDGKNLDKALKVAAENISDNFFKDFCSENTTIDEKTLKSLNQQLTQRAKEVTTLKVRVKNPTANQTDIDFSVKGLNYVEVMKQTSQTIFPTIANNFSLTNDNKKIIELTAQTLKEKLKTSEAVSENVTITIKFIKEKGKWGIAKNQEQNIKDFYLAYLTGIRNQTILDERVKQVIDLQEQTSKTQQNLEEETNNSNASQSI